MAAKNELVPKPQKTTSRIAADGDAHAMRRPRRPHVGDRRREWKFMSIDMEHDLSGFSKDNISKLIGNVIKNILRMHEARVMAARGNLHGDNLHTSNITTNPKSWGVPCGVEYHRFIDENGCLCVNVWTRYCPTDGSPPYSELTESYCEC